MQGPSAPADEGVRERIRSALDESLCVEAGAGTGKTTVLIERVVALLRSGRVTIDELAVITFTEKAAAELAARVRERLEGELAGGTAEPEAGRLRDALAGLHRARIETIHAFAGALLRERPVEARLDPGFEVRDAFAAGLDFDRAYSEWLTGLLESDSEPLARALNRGFDLRELRETAETLHANRHSPPPVVSENAARPDLAGFVAGLAQRCRELKQLEQLCTDRTDGAYRQIADIEAFAARLAQAGGESEVERLVLFRAPRLRFNVGSKQRWSEPDACDAVKGHIRDLRGELEALGAALRSDALLAVLPLALGFVRDYERRRRATGVAEFDDLLIWARDLLRDQPEVRAHFRRRLRSLLVDEFQDTDPVQAELIAYLCGDAPPAQWQAGAPGPGALCVVGDPKQSIYRFRRADIAIYDAVRRGSFGGRTERLTQNFRSLPGIIDWVNGAFDGLLVEEEGTQPANMRLEAEPAGLDPGRPPVVVVDGAETAASATQLREREAALIAALIGRAVGEEAWQVRDRGSDGARAASWRDVAMLMPTRRGSEIYEEALAAVGVPFRHEGNRAFYARQEVRELASCLEAVDDPTDSLGLVAALHSGAFGCSDEELFLFAQAEGRFDYRVKPPEGHAAVAAAMATLRELHRLRRELALPDLVARVVEDCRMVELALSRPAGEAAAGNLLKVVDQARAFAAARGGGLRTFVRWLADSRDSDAEEEEAVIAEEADDVVRLLTIHGAKGLEFPIVVLANLGADRRRTARPVPRPGGLEFRVGRKPWYATPGFDAAFEAEKRQMDAEDVRLLYVAATRARDHLVIPRVPTPNGVAGLMACLAPYLPEPGAEPGSAERGCHVYDGSRLELERPAAPAARSARPGEVERALAERDRWLAERESVLVEAARGLPVASASGAAGAGRALADEDADGVTPPSRAARLGEALHAVMERVGLPDAGNLEPLVVAACSEVAVADAAGEVEALVRNCLGSDLLRRALAAERLHREAWFDILLNGRFGTGRVDLLFREPDGLVIGDYKTGATPSGGELAPHHRSQAAVYALAAARATGLPVTEVVFLFAREGLEVPVTVDDALLAEGEDLINTSADLVEAP